MFWLGGVWLKMEEALSWLGFVFVDVKGRRKQGVRKVQQNLEKFENCYRRMKQCGAVRETLGLDR